MDSDNGVLGLLGSFLRNFVLFVYALFALFPLVWMVILSFKSDEQMFTTTFIFTPTLENFRVVLTQEGFLRSLWNNLVVSSLAVGLSLIVGIPAATRSADTNSKAGKRSPSPSSRSALLRKFWSSSRSILSTRSWA
jgi:multiple sugar transport system permease protein